MFFSPLEPIHISQKYRQSKQKSFDPMIINNCNYARCLGKPYLKKWRPTTLIVQFASTKKTKCVFVSDEQLGLTRTYKLCISNLFIKPGTTHARSVNPFRRQ